MHCFADFRSADPIQWLLRPFPKTSRLVWFSPESERADPVPNGKASNEVIQQLYREEAFAASLVLR